MHELLVNIDDTTYQRVIEDARIKGIELHDWIDHAMNDFLLRRQSAIKEVPACENETCLPGAVHVHAEVYIPHPGGACHGIVEQLQRQVRDLEVERDNLKVLLDQKNDPEGKVPGDETRIFTLQREIEKNAFDFDEMEAALERLRLERDRLLTDPKGTSRVQHIENEIGKQQFEVENFREEIAKLMSTRDTLRLGLAKKRR
ncbi:MAG: hypothetical protein NTV68_12570 [Methanomicrobiales archaeon]|nr:hypothetical protein [Methanomicrobiales archaeon]